MELNFDPIISLGTQYQSPGLYCSRPQSDYCIKVTVSKYISMQLQERKNVGHLSKKIPNIHLLRALGMGVAKQVPQVLATLCRGKNTTSETKRPRPEFPNASHCLCDPLMGSVSSSVKQEHPTRYESRVIYT